LTLFSVGAYTKRHEEDPLINPRTVATSKGNYMTQARQGVAGREEEVAQLIEGAALELPTGDYIALLERIQKQVQAQLKAARFASFGAQFPAADPAPAIDPPAGMFQKGDFLRTADGYVGYMAHYDKRGRAVVNVVWQACEYRDDQLQRFEG